MVHKPKKATADSQKQASSSAFETSLNMNEVKSVESLITAIDIASAKYKCAPTTLQLNAGNVNWTWSSKYNTAGGLDCSLLFTSNTTSTIWKITLHLSVFFKTKEGTTLKEILVRDQVFDHSHKEWKMELSPEEWNKLAASFEDKDREPNTSKTEPMTIEIQLCVSNMVGFRNRTEIGLDFSVARRDSDLLFLFGDKKVFLNVGYLAVLSPYFAATQERMENMPTDPETNICVEKMVDVDHDQFVELMQIVYPSRKKINDLNVEYVLQLADRFLFNNVLVDAERFLIEASLPNHDVFTKLQWSYTYSMADLQVSSK